ncbi:MAG TPA: hypothetical protein VG672_04365, partial [Bryobacteraceae bacterium]|nr:hypothetical protein [Bryobacteraceae bacterium]
MELAGKLMSLDPTSRRLSSAEKFRRSNEILSEVRDEVSGCLGGKTAPPELQTALDQGNELLGEKLRGVATNEMAEARLSAAENLWQHRPLACGAPPPADSAIALLLKKINQ